MLGNDNIEILTELLYGKCLEYSLVLSVLCVYHRQYKMTCFLKVAISCNPASGDSADICNSQYLFALPLCQAQFYMI